MKCWNCGVEMISIRDDAGHPYELCPQCEATHCDRVTLGYDPLAPHGSYVKHGTGDISARVRHPSKSVVRNARRAWDKTKDKATPKATTRHS